MMDLSSLKDNAIRVLEAVQNDSELRELWEENEELYPKWFENLETIKNGYKNQNKKKWAITLL